LPTDSRAIDFWENNMSVRPLRLLVLAAILSQLGCAQRPIDVRIVTPFPSKKSILPCDSNDSCKMKVYARIAAADKCEVMPEYETLFVMAGKTPTLRWEIESIDVANPFEYQFTLSPPGIDIQHYTSLDFDAPDHDGAKSKFKWKDKHQRSRPADPFNYDIHVERRRAGSTGIWSPCKALDPRIVND
jgi:hypothetical protein